LSAAARVLQGQDGSAPERFEDERPEMIVGGNIMTSDFTRRKELTEAVRISWMGHAMFLLEDGAGNRLVTDPYAEGVGYALPDVEADIVLVSHDHFDHANTGMVRGDPMIVSDASLREFGGIEIEGFPTYHDASGGAERGPNIAYRWRMQGMTFAHLGDLGHRLDTATAAGLAGTDVLFVPVGGTFTLDDAGAAQVVEELAPRIAVPMHFRNSACSFPIKTVEPFASRFTRVEETGKSPVYVGVQDLPEPTLLLVMDYLS
jgi:L-ascorbate metabolism protein UlaG (beta-lactamase superfamily)